MMACDDCPHKSGRVINNKYQLAQELFIKRKQRLRTLLDEIELHESYLSEIRRDLLKKIVQL
jgi:hypothetical protein